MRGPPRLELIFRGDKATYKKAKKASDHFEHGLSEHHEVQKMAIECVEKTAAYVRQAILDLVLADDQDRDLLTQTSYVSPANASGFSRQILGAIKVSQDSIAAPEQVHPYVRWEMRLQEFRRAPGGGHVMRVKQQITPVMAAGSVFELHRIHFAGPSETRQEEAEIVSDPTAASQEQEVVSVDDPSSAKWTQPVGAFILNCNAIRHYGLMWLQGLSGQPAYEYPKKPFAALIHDITEIVAASCASADLRERCRDAWQEAGQIDEVRSLVSGAATMPQGLVFFDQREGGRASTVEDVSKIKELSDGAIDLAKRLETLRIELQTVGVIRSD